MEFEKDPPKIQKSAQNAADSDNFKAAIARLAKNLLVAKITGGENVNIGTLQKLHPKSLNLPKRKQERVNKGSKLGRKEEYISPKMVIRTNTKQEANR